MSDHDLPPIELQAPDIARWKEGGSGVDWVHVLDSGRPGPKTMVQALTHGNEICGAIALDWLLASGFRPERGTLTVAFANIEAYARYDPAEPFSSRLVDEDYNRVWADDALFGPRDSLELRRARQLRPFVDAAELLLDIHSMSEPCRPLMVCGTVEKNVACARQLGMPGRPADRHRPPGWHAHGRPRRIRRPGEPEASAADRMRPALGTRGRRGGDRRARPLPRPSGVADRAWVQANTRLPLPPKQRLVRVTEPVVALSRGFPLPRADRRALGDRESRHADRARRRPRLDDALRRCGAGDAGNAKPQAGRDGGPARTVRGVKQNRRGPRKARAGRCCVVAQAWRRRRRLMKPTAPRPASIRT